MKTNMLLVGFLASLIGCDYPVILVGLRSKDWPHQIECWSKPDASTEHRVADSITCKGDEKGDPIESQANLQAAMLRK